MEKLPIVTVVTVCYNAAATIKKTLESVCSQDYPNLEHLIIDGNSKDGTLEIVKANSFKGTRVISEPDKGIYDAMNKGWQRAQGSIVGFLNADDHFADDTVISHVVGMLNDHPNSAWGFGITQCLNTENGVSVNLGQPPPLKMGEWQKRYLTMSGCGHPTVYARKMVFEDLGGFDLQYRICADTDWVIRVWKKYQPIFFDKKMVVMILGGASSNRKVISELFRVHEKHYENHFLNRLAYYRHQLGWYARTHLSSVLHQPYLKIRKLVLRDR